MRIYGASLGECVFDGLLVVGPAIGVLDVQSAHVLEADLHALLLGGSEQLVLEGVDAGVEALGVQVQSHLALHYYLIESIGCR